MVYVQIEEALFKELSDEFTCRVARKSVEKKELIEAGFNYVCTTPNELILFRMRK